MNLTTTGTTIILEGNMARARNMAIANGKRHALEEAVRQFVTEAVAQANYEVLNRNIYLEQEYLIDTFRILSETSRGKVYEVVIESAVSVENLKRTLVALDLVEQDREAELTRFKLEVSGVSCSPCLRALREYLGGEMEGVEEVSLHSIRPGSFTLDIVFKGNTEAFRDSLGLKTFERFRLARRGPRLSGHDLFPDGRG
jgi:hypothetical protein